MGNTRQFTVTLACYFVSIVVKKLRFIVIVTPTLSGGSVCAEFPPFLSRARATEPPQIQYIHSEILGKAHHHPPRTVFRAARVILLNALLSISLEFQGCILRTEKKCL